MIKLNPDYRDSSPTSKSKKRNVSAKSKMQTVRTRTANQSYESCLFDQFHQSPLLTKDEEYELARKIFLYRQAFQRLILKEPAVIQHITGLLSEWEAKNIRLDFVCNVALSETTKRKTLEPAIRKGLVRLRKLPRQLKGADSRAARALHRQTVVLVESLCIRPRVFEASPFCSPGATKLLAKYRDLCQQLTKANLRLVAQVARQICGKSPLLLDMIQEGTQGLMHAVTKFDHQRRMRFSTYATPWIRQHIYAALPNAQRTIRLPESYRSVGKKVNAHVNRVQCELEKLEQESGTVVRQVAEQLNMKTADVIKHIRMRRTTGSLDQVVDRSPGNLSLGEMIVSETNGPQVATQILERHEQTMQVVNHSLNARERDVISLRYGLADGIDRSFAEVGREMGITRERVRQIEKPALEKLSRLKCMIQLCKDE